LNFAFFTTDGISAVKQSQACIKFLWIWEHNVFKATLCVAWGV